MKKKNRVRIIRWLTRYGPATIPDIAKALSLSAHVVRYHMKNINSRWAGECLSEKGRWLKKWEIAR